MNKDTYQRIAVRLPTDEYDSIVRKASEKGIPVASYVRFIIQLYNDREDLDERIRKIVDERLKEKFS